jgi:hypothetical protein
LLTNFEEGEGGARSRVSDIGVIICNGGRVCARVGIGGKGVEK